MRLGEVGELAPAPEAARLVAAEHDRVGGLGLQLLSCVPNLTLGNQVMHHLLTEQLSTTPIAIEGGRASIPSGPGLGCELDHDAVDRARRRYEEQGAY